MDINAATTERFSFMTPKRVAARKRLDSLQDKYQVESRPVGDTGLSIRLRGKYRGLPTIEGSFDYTEAGRLSANAKRVTEDDALSIIMSEAKVPGTGEGSAGFGLGMRRGIINAQISESMRR